jgi:hypothetical protein
MMTTRRKPEKSGAAKMAENLSGLFSGKSSQRPRRGAAGGRTKKRRAAGGGKKRAAGLTLLAGAAGLVMKNREKVTSMIRDRGSSDRSVDPVEPRPVPNIPGRPQTPEAAGRPLGSADHPTT